MTFSICVREQTETTEVGQTLLFGVAVTTRRPSVGSRCPYVSENGAIATQSRSKPEFGKKGLCYLSDSLAIEDALGALLNADDEAPERQVHGVDASGSFAFTGDECRSWCGHRCEDSFTVAGNILTGSEVIEEVAATYENSTRDDPLPKRLIDSLEAGHEAGGDRRDRRIQSAACIVRSRGNTAVHPFTHDLRVDASESPISDLRETYESARSAFEG